MDRAADAVDACEELGTLGQALNSNSERLQFWAIWCFPGQYAKARDAEEAETSRPVFDRLVRPTKAAAEARAWRRLFPRLRELAKGPNAHIRSCAQDCLWRCGGHGNFLGDCLEWETDAGNILRFLENAEPSGPDARSGRDRKMNARLLRLLAHPEDKVREGAVQFISWRTGCAPVWQVDFSPEILPLVLELSRIGSVETREAAVGALAELRKHEPEAVRQRLIELARDESEEVRWRIPLALKSDLDRADVQAVLDQLRRDPSPDVRYWAISELGPTKYKDEYIQALRERAAREGEQEGTFAVSRLISFIGEVKSEEHIAILLKHLDYIWQKCDNLEFTYPAIKALTEIGKPAATAALAELAKVQSDLRVRLLARVIWNVEGPENARRLLESESAKSIDEAHKGRLRAALRSYEGQPQ